jgi:putative DNA primase/helicase
MSVALTVQDAVKAAVRAGLCVVPPREDGSKMPVTTWKQWQAERPSAGQINAWYASGERAGVGLVCGAISLNLELQEFEDEATYRLYKDNAEAVGLGALVERIEDGYLERSPGGGYHWLYRCVTAVEGNTILARHADGAVRIETRGEGGYVVIAPSHGSVHPSGGAYELLRGSLDRVVTITANDRAALHRLAEALDELPKQEYAPSTPYVAATNGSGESPGDAYDRQASWDAILGPHGWECVARHGQVQYWKRPGSDNRWSATINGAGVGPNRLYVFSSNAHPLEPKRSYRPFQAYALLEHDGDFKAAAGALRRAGYGAPTKLRRVVAGAGHTNGANGQQEPADSAAPIGYPRTDTGNAERLIARYGDRVRFNYGREKWHVWSGRHWQVDNSGEIERLAKETMRSVPFEEGASLEGDRYTELLKWAASSESNTRRQSMIRLARSEEGVPIQPVEMDANPWLLNVANGTLDLHTGTLGPHERSHLITRLIDTDYTPDATCARWTAFLEQIFAGDQALIGYVQRLVGYSLTGSTREQIVIIAYGTGSNGKSTLLNVLRHLLGDYAREANSDSFMDKRGDAIREDIADLDGARFVAASETSDGRRLSESLVKKMTGGEQLRARRLYENGIEFQPQFKLWLSTNHRPVIRGSEYAIWRRIKLIPFTVTIPDDQKDPDLGLKLMAEAQGILAWAVRGCLAWQSTGLREPAAVTNAVTAYRHDMDQLAEWIEAACVVHATVKDEPTRLYNNYSEHCKERGDTPMSMTGFGRKLGEKGFELRRTMNQRYRVGIRLRGTEPEPMQERFGLGDAETAAGKGHDGFGGMTGHDTVSQELSFTTFHEGGSRNNPSVPVIEPNPSYSGQCADCGAAISSGARCSACAAAATPVRDKKR